MVIKIENKELYKELKKLESQLIENSKTQEYLKKRIEIAEKQLVDNHNLDSKAIKKILISGLKDILEDK